MTHTADSFFKEHLTEILRNGSRDENPRPKYADGTPAHTRFITHVFENYDIRFALAIEGRGFPCNTLRNTALKTGIQEIFWIYQDQSNRLSDAHKRGITWWDEFDIGDGTIGDRYGQTVHKYSQMDNLLEGLKNNPFGRRHIIDLWQLSDFHETKGLNPCAFLTSWSVRRTGGKLVLDMFLHQRSADFLMARAINQTQYIALQMMVAYAIGMEVGEFSHFTDNLHIYERHFDQAEELLDRDGRNDPVWFRLKSDTPRDFYKMSIDNFEFFNPSKYRKLKKPLELAV
jgi:thymidylate synthase